MEESTKLTEYYAKRAYEYENIYRKPERQANLQKLQHRIADAFQGTDVLEIACGTGYWTQFLARSANSIDAVDYNAEVLEIAKTKNYGNCSLQFIQDDAYQLNKITKKYPAAFCGFWWSHILLGRIPQFLSVFHSRLKNNGKIVLLDNLYIEGSNTPISRIDEEGNTYQQRQLQDGTNYEVLKNFPTEKFLHDLLSKYAINITYEKYEYYWLVEYQNKR